MDYNMDKLQMASQCTGLSHKRAEEAVPNAQQNTFPPHLTLKLWRKSGPEQQKQQFSSVLQVSKKQGPFTSSLPPLATAYLLSITVNITEQEVEGWEEAEHKPAAQCTCLAAACSDI